MSISAFRRVFIPLLVAGLALALFALSSGTSTRADPLVGPTFAPIIKTNTCNGLPNDFQAPAVLQDILRGPNSRASGAGCTGASTAPSSHPIIDTFFDIPRNDLMYNQGYWLSTLRGVTLNDQNAIPEGALMGGLSGQVSLGLLASFCQDKFSTPDFIWWKATSDNVGSVVQTNPEGTANRWFGGTYGIVTDVGDGPSPPLHPNGTGPDGLADNDSLIVSGYPDFLNKLFDPDGNGVDNGTLGTRPVTPVARYAGASQVPAGGDWQTLQVIIFNASDLQAAYSANATTINHPFAKLTPAVGLVTFIILNDPTAVTPSVSQISDFCTSLIVNGMTLGQAWDVMGSETPQWVDVFTNNTGSTVDDLHVTFDSTIYRVVSISGGSGPDTWNWQIDAHGNNTNASDCASHAADNVVNITGTGGTAVTPGGTLTVVVQACSTVSSLTATAQWTSSGSNVGSPFDVTNYPYSDDSGDCADNTDNDGDTVVDEADPDCRINRVTAPATPGSYMAQVRTQSLRDLDGDGVANDEDSCPYTFNTENFMLASGVGPDGDMLDSSCDPTPSAKSRYNPTNSEDGAGANTCSDGIDNGNDGKQVIDGGIDVNGDTVVNAADDGTVLRPIIDGHVDMNGDTFINTCGDIIDNGGDTVADTNDADCHSDGDAGNAGSYVPTRIEDGIHTDSGRMAGVAIIDGGVDITGNGVVDGSDDGRIAGADAYDSDCEAAIATTDIDNDGYENAQDPCPLVANASPLDSEPGLAFSTAAPDGGPPSDSIGDQCDTHPTVADGDWFNTIYIDSICVTSNAAVDDTDNDGWCENDGDNNDNDPGTGIHFEAGPGGVFTDQYPDATDPDVDSTVYTVANSNQEWAVGVDALNACPLIAGHDTWPPDFSRLAGDNVPDGKSDIFDISLMTPPVFGKSAGQTGYVQRLDLSRLAGDGVPDGKIDIFDISLLTPPVFGKTSLPGGCPALKGH